MIDYTETNDPGFQGGEILTFNGLRRLVLEALGSITNKNLIKLIESIPVRCQAVIDADGAYISYWAVRFC